MSTLQEFLIKNAGMEKWARTAIAKRLLASIMTPQEVVKRFGKVRGNRYLDDITTAVKNHVNAQSTSGSNDVGARAYLLRTIADNTSQKSHFNKKLSKSNYLNHLTLNPSISNRGIKYNDSLHKTRSQSGLSSLHNTLPRQDRSLHTGGAPTLPDKSQYAETLQRQYGIKSREELIKEMQDHGIDFNPEELQHSHYVTGKTNVFGDSGLGVDPKHRLLAATKLPFTTPDRLPSQAAALEDVLTTSGRFNSLYLGANMSALPRSVQKALQIIKGENLLEPGTHASRLFNKVYNNKALNDKLGLTDKFQKFVDGENAAYVRDLDTILVHPRALGIRNKAGIEAHERGHRAASTMPPEAHADEAFREFRKMQLLGKKYNMNVPIDDPKLMQEAFAESYVRKLLGPNSGAASFVSPRQYLRDTMKSVLDEYPNITQPMKKIVHRKILEQYKANRDAINAMRTSEDTKDLFRQLAFNYGHELV